MRGNAAALPSVRVDARFGCMRSAFLILVVSLCALGCSSEVCIQNGKSLDEGDTYSEDCNTCTCNENGSITCVQDDSCSVCNYEGTGYDVGDSWPKGDGCNLCQCVSAGEVSCTETPCGGG
jgi:hypothetical protein